MRTVLLATDPKGAGECGGFPPIFRAINLARRRLLQLAGSLVERGFSAGFVSSPPGAPLMRFVRNRFGDGNPAPVYY
jgi:hypothetical protein